MLPTYSRDAVTSFPRCLTLCLCSLWQAAPACWSQLAPALPQHLRGIKRCWHIPARAKEGLQMLDWKEVGVQLWRGYCKHGVKLI